MAATLVTYVVGLAIRFGITPYIVGTLGAEAYGFIGLASNILSYTTLITVALNSMAGRFITIQYQKGDIEGANKYFASVFYSNLFLATVILLFSVGCVIWLENLINIPPRLVFDVKLLFSILAVNNLMGLVLGTWGVATFIKNRLELSNICSIIGQFVNAFLTILLFALFAPHIWYVGLTGFVCSIITAGYNLYISGILTPELRVSSRNYEWKRVVELLKSGVWNLISRLGDILGMGLDLLIANLFLGPALMGSFALSKNVPTMIVSLFASIAGNFAPLLTTLYAKGQIEEMLHEIKKSIRILGFLTALPLVSLYVLGKDFYALWLPTEDAGLLQLITIVGSLGMVAAMPLEVLWNIFTITNKMRWSSLFIFFNHALTALSVIIAMFITDDEMIRLLVLASTRSVIGVIRSLTFLPMYGAYCLGQNIFSLYRPIFKSVLSFAVAFGICYFAKKIFVIDTWSKLIVAGFAVVCICLTISGFIILEKHDRAFLLEKVNNNIIHKISRR